MGLNAYFAYQIVGFHSNGIISYNLALTAVFVEGFVFIFLSLIGMRQCEWDDMPHGQHELTYIRACKDHSSVSQNRCSLWYRSVSCADWTEHAHWYWCSQRRTNNFATDCWMSGRVLQGWLVCQPQDDIAYCKSQQRGRCRLLIIVQMWLGITAGGILTAYLMAFKVKSAMIAGILLVSIISWPSVLSPQVTEFHWLTIYD
jgi:adenine/guanine/hypoxanthine permease